MKYLIYSAVILFVLAVGFSMWTWRNPYHLGWQGEMPVGFYRFQVVTYQITDYGHKNNVGAFDVLGGTYSFIAHITGVEKLEISDAL